MKEDDESCGRSNIRSTVIANIKLKTCFTIDRRLTVQILQSEPGISKNTVHRIFIDDLHKIKVVQCGCRRCFLVKRDSTRRQL